MKTIAQANEEAIVAIRTRCHMARIKPTELCELAGIARTTFWRAEKYPEKATFETFNKLETALDKIESEGKAKAA